MLLNVTVSLVYMGHVVLTTGICIWRLMAFTIKQLSIEGKMNFDIATRMGKSHSIIREESFHNFIEEDIFNYMLLICSISNEVKSTF